MLDVGASSCAHLTWESVLEAPPDSDGDLALLGAATRGGRSQHKDKGTGDPGPYSQDSLAT